MKKEEIRKAVSECLGCSPGCVEIGSQFTEVHNSSLNTSYNNMLVLTQRLGTTNIDVSFSEGDPGYSEETPGWPSDLCVTIKITPED